MGWVGVKVKKAIAKVGFDVVNNGVQGSMKKWFSEKFDQYLDSAGASAHPDIRSPTPFDDTPQQQCFASVFELLSSLGITKIEESALQKMASELEECEWSCADLLITDSEKDEYASAVSMFELCESISKKDAAMLRTKLTEHSEGSGSLIDSYTSLFELLSSLGITKIEEGALQKMASELEECEWSCADLLITDSERDNYVSATRIFELCKSISKKDAAILRTKLTKHSERFVPLIASLLLNFECSS